MDSLTGFVIAGGKSSRMKIDKGLLTNGNKFLIEYTIGTLQQVTDSVIINTGNHDYQRFGHELITDTISSCGPLCGLITCLRNTKTEMNVFLPVDTPFVNKSLLLHLMAEANGYRGAIPVIKGKYEPLIAIYNKNLLPYFEKAYHSNNFKLIEILKSLEINFVEISSDMDFYNENLFLNINTPEDFKKFVDLKK